MKAIVFDAYGTLLDVHAAMALHAKDLPENWPQISAEWRSKQLEYTWIRTLSRQHKDFWQLTQEALDYVATKYQVTDPKTLATLLDTYLHLPAYPDATPTLVRLRQQGYRTAILSNGTPDMLAAAANSAGLAPLLDAILSIETIGAFKTDPRCYALMTAHFHTTPDQIGFVSSNPWDAYAAHLFGCQVFWINRASNPEEYNLRTTATELKSLSEILA